MSASDQLSPRFIAEKRECLASVAKLPKHTQPREIVEMRVATTVGYFGSVIGTVVWLYGYLITGNPPMINWHSITPWWIANFLPNIETEIGTAIVIVSMIPIYCRPGRNGGIEREN